MRITKDSITALMIGDGAKNQNSSTELAEEINKKSFDRLKTSPKGNIDTPYTPTQSGKPLTSTKNTHIEKKKIKVNSIVRTSLKESEVNKSSIVFGEEIANIVIDNIGRQKALTLDIAHKNIYNEYKDRSIN